MSNPLTRTADEWRWAWIESPVADLSAYIAEVVVPEVVAAAREGWVRRDGNEVVAMQQRITQLEAQLAEAKREAWLAGIALFKRIVRQENHSEDRLRQALEDDAPGFVSCYRGYPLSWWAACEYPAPSPAAAPTREPEQCKWCGDPRAGDEYGICSECVAIIRSCVRLAAQHGEGR